MRKFRDIFRLHHESRFSHRAIASALNVSYGSVVNYLARAQKANLSWPLPDTMDDRVLSRTLFPTQTGPRHFVELDYPAIYQELKRKGVTKWLLWKEYRQCHPEDGYSYAQFCHRYREWCKKQKRSMRQTHVAGEKLFLDYCGQTVPIINPDTGEIRTAEIFVSVLGASNYTFAIATWSQKQEDWIHANVKALEFYGGVPQLLVPDNLKSAVRKANRYTPDLNPAYQQMASHYQTAILPARPYKPKDKAKVEVAVQIVERWILARLRHHTFFTLVTLNQKIKELLVELNQRPFKKLPGCRLSQFEKIDKPALKSLPSQPYEYVDIKFARVHIDYHIEYDKHYYSVPHHLVKQQVEVHASCNVVSIYVFGNRVASHARSLRPGGHSTHLEHMPQNHRAMREWTPERFIKWAADIGPHVKHVTEHLLKKKRHPEQNYRAILGLLNLSKKYGRDRLNKACYKAITINSRSTQSIKSILKNGIDKINVESPEQDDLFLESHENIRGEKYYH